MYSTPATTHCHSILGLSHTQNKSNRKKHTKTKKKLPTSTRPPPLIRKRKKEKNLCARAHKHRAWRHQPWTPVRIFSPKIQCPSALTSNQKRPTIEAKKKSHCPSALTSNQKRPTIEAKETYYRGKRDILERQKRHTIEANETHRIGHSLWMIRHKS